VSTLSAVLDGPVQGDGDGEQRGRLPDCGKCTHCLAKYGLEQAAERARGQYNKQQQQPVVVQPEARGSSGDGAGPATAADAEDKSLELWLDDDNGYVDHIGGASVDMLAGTPNAATVMGTPLTGSQWGAVRRARASGAAEENLDDTPGKRGRAGEEAESAYLDSQLVEFLSQYDSPASGSTSSDSTIRNRTNGSGGNRAGFAIVAAARPPPSPATTLHQQWTPPPQTAAQPMLVRSATYAEYMQHDRERREKEQHEKHREEYMQRLQQHVQPANRAPTTQQSQHQQAGAPAAAAEPRSQQQPRAPLLSAAADQQAGAPAAAEPRSSQPQPRAPVLSAAAAGAQTMTARDMFVQPLLPGMLPLQARERSNGPLMQFIALVSTLRARKRCMFSACKRGDWHALESCEHYISPLCKHCGQRTCPAATSRGKSCAKKLAVPKSVCCFHCWINHEGLYNQCVESGSLNYVRPIVFFCVHYAGLSMTSTWAEMWATTTNRFEYLFKLIHAARTVPHKPDPFVTL